MAWAVQSTVFQCGGQGSIPSQCMWDSWQTKMTLISRPLIWFLFFNAVMSPLLTSLSKYLELKLDYCVVIRSFALYMLGVCFMTHKGSRTPRRPR